MNTQQEPIILSEGNYTKGDIENLRSENNIWQETDIYPAESKEYFEITHPKLAKTDEFDQKADEFVATRTDGGYEEKGDWVYYPWSGRLVHMVNEDEYFALKTNRNKNLITKEEQDKLRNACIGLVGLSVGSNVATALSYCGIGKTFKMAEFDELETTNLNRIRARVDQIGLRKIDVVAQQIYEVNPHANIQYFDQGITKETLSDFVLSEPKPDVLFEIIDSFEMKIHLRALARKHSIPVIMVTNIGDRLIMDVERYDLDQNTKFFNGRAGKVPQDILDNPDVTEADKHKYACELAGIELIPKRAMESVAEIGRTLIGRPQLASTVTLSAGFSAYFVRKIVLGEDLPSGSWLIDQDKMFVAEASL